MMKILGISAFYHDSAAALISDGEILVAAQEERFTRKKHDASFPAHAIEFCLEEAQISLTDIDYISFYDKPFLKFERLIETYMAFAPKGFRSFSRALPLWVKEKLFQKKLIIDEFKKNYPNHNWEEKILFTEHHHSHAASAFYPSPFDEALVLTMDGVGEWATTSAAIGKGNQLEIFKEIHFPHSIGLFYSAMTYFCGFKVNSGEYKLMGLAPYGEPKYTELIKEHLIDIKEDGSFRLNMKYFDYCTGLKMTSKHFDKLFNLPSRKPEEEITQVYRDLAASAQKVTEEIIIKLAKSLLQETGMKNLCLAGGVALNCVANGRLLKEIKNLNLWIQPAAGDAGGALGSALASHYYFLNNKREVSSKQKDKMKGSLLGPNFTQHEVEKRLKKLGAKFKVLPEEEMIHQTALAISQEKAVGWFQGKMEFGPRALGARSILGDPRSPDTQKNLNLKIKFRESFRPFAPSILEERTQDYFDLEVASPYMLLVADVNEEKRLAPVLGGDKGSILNQLHLKRSVIPAVTHVDHSARVQSVNKETQPLFYRLIKKFEELTGCPLLVNTSFNVRGEPIVCTPEDAFQCFMGTNLDLLVIGSCILFKPDQPANLRGNYHSQIDPD